MSLRGGSLMERTKKTFTGRVVSDKTDKTITNTFLITNSFFLIFTHPFSLVSYDLVHIFTITFIANTNNESFIKPITLNYWLKF